MLDRTIAPPNTLSYDISFPKVKSKVLSGGVPLHLLNTGTQPVLKLEVLFPQGGSYDESKAGVSLIALKMLKEGTQSYSSNEIASHFAQYGAFLEIHPSFDVPAVTLYCLSKHLSRVLPYLNEVLHSPTFPDQELGRVLHIEKQQLQLQNERSNIVATKKFRNLLFGPEHPYGRIIEEADLNQIRYQELDSFHQKHFTNYEILVSGEVSNEMLSVLESHFENIAPKSILSRTYQGVTYPNTSEYLEPWEDALQSSIRHGRQVIDKTHQDYIPLLIATTVLGGYFGSRLMKNIREDKGYTYGIYSSLVSLKNQTYFVIATDVKKEFCQATLEEINKELHQLLTDPIDDQELKTVKNYMLGHFQSQLNSAFSLAEKFKDIHIYGLTYEYYDRFLKTLQNIDSEDVLAIANKYLHPDSMKTVIIG